MNLENFLFKIGLKLSPNLFISVLKLAAAYLRSLEQKIRIRKHKKKKRVLVFAMPKSGSTWLEELLSVYFDLPKYMPYRMNYWEFKFGDSVVAPFSNKDMLIDNWGYISKFHCYPNKDILKLVEAGEKLIVLRRNINDVLHSHLKYARNTPFHNDNLLLNDLDNEEAKKWIRLRYSGEFKLWNEYWDDVSRKFPKNILFVTYEELKNNTHQILTQIISFIDRDKINPEKLANTIKYCSMNEMKNRAVQKNFFR